MQRAVRRLLVLVLGCIGGGCSLISGQIDHQRPTPQRPVAFAIFDQGQVPQAAGLEGKLVGFLADAFDASSQADPRKTHFTYSVDFRIVRSSGPGEEVIGDGVRTIYYHPNGARASFSDVGSFKSGSEVETDRVSLRLRHMVDSTLRVRLLCTGIESRYTEYQGRQIVLPSPPEETITLVGRYRPDLKGMPLSQVD
jgi:hypothetical protein